jgi:sulfur dioxygenase
MIFKQVRSTDDTGTLTYLVADDATKRAALIDPNVEDLQRISYMLDELGVHLTHVIDTHTHADHISAAGDLKKARGARVVMHENTKNKWNIVDQGDKFGIGDILRANAAVEVDQYVNDGDTLALDGLAMRVLFTPGHTDNHISLLLEDNLFTGDLLLIGQAGRSDLPGGNLGEQYDSLFAKILPLPNYVKIYPGHDYEGNTFSYLYEERKFNPFLRPRTKEEYASFVADFFPPFTDVEAGGKAILQCGTKRVSTSAEEFQELSPDRLAEMLQEGDPVFLLDVREPFELVAVGAIPGVTNISVRDLARRIDELPRAKSHKVVVICQTGNRSFEAAHYLVKQGYQNVFNLQSGTTGWLQSGKKVIRSGQPVRMVR